MLSCGCLDTEHKYDEKILFTDRNCSRVLLSALAARARRRTGTGKSSHRGIVEVAGIFGHVGGERTRLLPQTWHRSRNHRYAPAAYHRRNPGRRNRLCLRRQYDFSRQHVGRPGKDRQPVAQDLVSYAGRAVELKSIAEIKGKTIAVTIGAADDFVARLLVRRGGLDPRDVSFVNMGGSDTRFPGAPAGSIDATPLSLPFFVIAKRQGYNLLGTAADVIDMATVGIGTSTRKIQQEREQVKKMLRAQLDTLRWIKTQKAEVVPFLQKFFDLEEDVAAGIPCHLLPSLIDRRRQTLAEAIKTVLDQQGKPDLPLDRVVDATIVEEVLRERR